MLQRQIYILSTALHSPWPPEYGTHNLQLKQKLLATVVTEKNQQIKPFKVPVSNLDSSGVKTWPVEYEPNLALVYFRTIFGPNGPKPLHNKFPPKRPRTDKFYFWNSLS